MNTKQLFAFAAIIVATLGSQTAASQAADLYVSYLQPSTIHRFDSSGNDLGTFVNTGGPYPNGLAFDSHANLYVVNEGADTNPSSPLAGSIHKFSPTGADLGTLVGGLNDPKNLAIDGHDNLFVTSPTNGAILRYGPTGAVMVTFANVSLGSGLGIFDMAFDSHGNLYVAVGPFAPAGASTIRKFSPTGTSLGIFASTTGPPLYSIAIDTSENLYASFGNNTIRKFGPTGADLGIFASTGLNAAGNMAFDASGNLYAINYNDDTIHKFGSDGADLGVFANAGGNGAEDLAFAPVPEPSSITLLAIGAGAVFFLLRGSRGRDSIEWPVRAAETLTKTIKRLSEILFDGLSKYKKPSAAFLRSSIE